MKSTTTWRMRAAAGFTLLEVLISIVVVAFGLLGLAGLQVFALRNNVSAAQRVTAAHLTAEIVDRMKANYVGVVAGLYNNRDVGGYGGPAKDECFELDGACSSTELATTDRFQWQQRVAAMLPGGQAVVCIDRTPATADAPSSVSGCDNEGLNNYVVKIWWYDERGKGTETGQLKYMYTTFNP